MNMLREGGGETEGQWDEGTKIAKRKDSTLQLYLGHAKRRRCFVVPKGWRSSKHYQII